MWYLMRRQSRSAPSTMVRRPRSSSTSAASDLLNIGGIERGQVKLGVHGTRTRTTLKIPFLIRQTLATLLFLVLFLTIGAFICGMVKLKTFPQRFVYSNGVFVCPFACVAVFSGLFGARVRTRRCGFVLHLISGSSCCVVYAALVIVNWFEWRRLDQQLQTLRTERNCSLLCDTNNDLEQIDRLYLGNQNSSSQSAANERQRAALTSSEQSSKCDCALYDNTSIAMHANVTMINLLSLSTTLLIVSLILSVQILRRRLGVTFDEVDDNDNGNGVTHATHSRRNQTYRERHAALQKKKANRDIDRILFTSNVAANAIHNSAQLPLRQPTRSNAKETPKRVTTVQSQSNLKELYPQPSNSFITRKGNADQPSHSGQTQTAQTSNNSSVTDFKHKMNLVLPMNTTPGLPIHQQTRKSISYETFRPVLRQKRDSEVSNKRLAPGWQPANNYNYYHPTANAQMHTRL